MTSIYLVFLTFTPQNLLVDHKDEGKTLFYSAIDAPSFVCWLFNVFRCDRSLGRAKQTHWSISTARYAQEYFLFWLLHLLLSSYSLSSSLFIEHIADWLFASKVRCIFNSGIIACVLANSFFHYHRYIEGVDVLMIYRKWVGYDLHSLLSFKT